MSDHKCDCETCEMFRALGVVHVHVGEKEQGPASETHTPQES